MATILKTKSIYFNDVNLLPRQGKVKSRKDVPNEMWRIIASPMAAVVGRTFAREAASLNLSLCVPRFLSFEEKIKIYNEFIQNKINSNQLCFFSIGLNESEENLKVLKKEGVDNILVDIANGYLILTLKYFSIL